MDIERDAATATSPPSAEGVTALVRYRRLLDGELLETVGLIDQETSMRS